MVENTKKLTRPFVGYLVFTILFAGASSLAFFPSAVSSVTDSSLSERTTYCHLHLLHIILSFLLLLLLLLFFVFISFFLWVSQTLKQKIKI